jgi:sporulation protein YlmC with PRC-barrel domain
MAMDTKIQFQKNAVVVDSNGQQIGSLHRVVVDPNTKVLTNIVIRTGALFNQEERVVPIDCIAETTPDLIILSEDVKDLKNFLPFEEEHIVDIEEHVEHSSPGASVQPTLYGSPLFGVVPQTRIDEEFATRVDQNIPEGTVAMREGAKVISADGKNLGTIERIFTDITDEQITDLLISQGKIKKKTKLVPIEWVNNINEEEVSLLVNKISVDSLDDIPIPEK